MNEFSYLSKEGLAYFWQKMKTFFVTQSDYDSLEARVTNNEDGIEECRTMIRYRRDVVVEISSIVPDSTYSQYPFSTSLSWPGCTEDHINWASLSITCSYKKAYAVETKVDQIKIYFEKMPSDITFSLLAIGKGVEFVD